MAQIDLNKITSQVKQKYQIKDNTFFATPKDDLTKERRKNEFWSNN